jgi:excisionase family DNA binding protein
MSALQQQPQQHDTLGTLRFAAWAALSGSAKSAIPGGALSPVGRRAILARLRRADPAYKAARGGQTEGHGNDRSIGQMPMHLTLHSDRQGMRDNPAQSETFFTERSLAAYLAVSDRTIRNWIRRGELPSYKLGAARRINPADVDAFLEARRDEAA